MSRPKNPGRKIPAEKSLYPIFVQLADLLAAYYILSSNPYLI